MASISPVSQSAKLLIVGMIITILCVTAAAAAVASNSNSTSSHAGAQDGASDSDSGSSDSVALEGVIIESGITGDLHWSYNKITNVLNITWDGRMADYSYENPAPWHNWTIDNIIFNGSVTHIGDYAFQGVKGDCNVTISGSSVLSIGNHAFEGSSVSMVTLSYSPGKPMTGHTVITEVGAYAFANTHLKYMYDGRMSAPTDLIDLSEVTAIRAGAFSCSTVGTVYIADGAIIEDYAFNECTSLHDVQMGDSDIPVGAFEGCSSLKTVAGFSGSVIGSSAFDGCSRLSSIDLQSVTSIGAHAFSGCSALTFIDLRNQTSVADYAFSGCTGITDVVFPIAVSEVFDIGDHAFAGCTGLTRLDFSNTVVSIGSYAFAGCSSLCSFTFGMGGNIICSHAFSGDAFKTIRVTNMISYVGDGAFSDMPSLEELYIYGDGSEFGLCPFESDVNLSKVVLFQDVVVGSRLFDGIGKDVCEPTGEPRQGCLRAGTYVEAWGYLVRCESGVTGDCTWTFNGYDLVISGFGAMSDYSEAEHAPWFGWKIGGVEVGYGVSTVGAYAFTSCKDLMSVSLGDDVVSIGDNAFGFCNSLTSVSMPCVHTIGYHAFVCCYYLCNVEGTCVITIGEGAFEGCTWLSSVPFVAVQTVGDSAFAGCLRLTAVDLTSVQTIGDGAFLGCINLAAVDLASVQTIGDYAFCLTGLTKIELPFSLTHVGDYAFSQCARLATVYIDCVNEALGERVFDGDHAISDFALSYDLIGCDDVLGDIGKGFADWDLNPYTNGDFIPAGWYREAGGYLAP